MTSIFSSNAFKYYRYRIFSRKAPLILLIILNVLSYPLLFGTMLAGTNFKPFYDMIIASFAICVVALAVSFITGFYLAISAFNYLHDRSFVDMNMSLPLTSGQRFGADFLAGLTIYAVPYIASSLIGLILYSITSSVGFTSFVTDSISANTILEVLPPSDALQYMFSGLIAMIMLYSLVVLVTSFCGSVVEATIYSLLVNIMLTVGATVTSLIVYGSTFGLTSNSGMLDIIGASSPFGELYTTISTISLFSMSSVGRTPDILSVPIVICNLIFIALCIGGAYFAVKRRKAEQVGKPFVYRAAYYAIIAVIMYGIVAVFMQQVYNRVILNKESVSQVRDGVTLFITMVVITFIVFLVFDCITGRGFKKIWRGLLRYVLTLLSCIVVSVILIKADGFGISYYVLDADDIERVTVSVETTNYPFNERNQEMELVFTEKSSVEKVVQVHKDAIDIYKKSYQGNGVVFDYPYKETGDIVITYKMKTGGFISRNYRVPYELINGLKVLPVSEETKLARYNLIEEALPEDMEESFTVRDLIACREANVNVTREQFLEALKKDILAETDEQFMGDFLPVGSVDIYIKTYYSEIMYIKPSYRNVIALFGENGAGDILTADFTENIGDNDNLIVYIYQTNGDEYTDFSDYSDYYVKIKHDDRLKEFLKKCVVSFDYDKYYQVPNRYFVRFFTHCFNTLIVPRELYDEAKQIINAGTKPMGAMVDSALTRKLFDITGIEYSITDDGYVHYDLETYELYMEHASNILLENGYEPESYDKSTFACAHDSYGNTFVVDANDNIVFVDLYDGAIYAEDTEVA